MAQSNMMARLPPEARDGLRASSDGHGARHFMPSHEFELPRSRLRRLPLIEGQRFEFASDGANCCAAHDQPLARIDLVSLA